MRAGLFYSNQYDPYCIIWMRFRSVRTAPRLPGRIARPKGGAPWGHWCLQAGWIHEIKHDGYRMLALRAGERARLITRNGHDWGERFPAVTKALELLEGEVLPDRR